MKEEIAEEIKQMISNLFDVPLEKMEGDVVEIDRHLGLDSLEKAELVVEIESKYNIVIDEKLFNNSFTINQVADYVCKLIGED